MHASANQGIDKQNNPGGGEGIRQGKRRQILSRDNWLPKQEPNKKNKQHRTVKAGTIRE